MKKKDHFIQQILADLGAVWWTFESALNESELEQAAQEDCSLLSGLPYVRALPSLPFKFSGPCTGAKVLGHQIITIIIITLIIKGGRVVKSLASVSSAGIRISSESHVPSLSEHILSDLFTNCETGEFQC